MADNEYALAADTAEARKFIKDRNFELILCDVNMPGESGIDFIRHVAAEYADTAIMMMTAVDDPAVAETAMEVGVYGYMIKPFKPNEVLINIRNSLRRRELEVANRDVIIQQEKMATIGQLAAGVAHEVNNPIGYISSNLRTLRKYLDKITRFMSKLSQVFADQTDNEELRELMALKKSLKLALILEDINDLIDESLDGTEKMKIIVQDLKSFSRADKEEPGTADINECLESALNVAWNELKYKATVNKEFGELLAIQCYPNQLGQVFLNILINAAHAIEKQGEVTIKSWQDNKCVRVSIADTGSGIKADNLQKIFTPFFTTKEAGKGTGLGMAIAQEIIAKHQGKITVESEIGKGTTFTITLPIT